jgi:hypothetical protein
MSKTRKSVIRNKKNRTYKKLLKDLKKEYLTKEQRSPSSKMKMMTSSTKEES